MCEALLHLHLERVVPGPAVREAATGHAGKLRIRQKKLLALHGGAVDGSAGQESRERVGYLRGEIGLPECELRRGQRIDVLAGGELAGPAADIRDIEHSAGRKFLLESGGELVDVGDGPALVRVGDALSGEGSESERASARLIMPLGKGLLRTPEGV